MPSSFPPFAISICREIPSLSASNSELISKKNKKGKKNIGGDFHTVDPPTRCSCSKLKSPSGFVPFRHQVYPDFESLFSRLWKISHWPLSPFFWFQCLFLTSIFELKGKMKYKVPPPSRYNQTNRQQHWYNVIPSSAKVAQIGQQSDRFQNCNVVGESVDLDLSLKLWTSSSHFLWCHL